MKQFTLSFVSKQKSEITFNLYIDPTSQNIYSQYAYYINHKINSRPEYFIRDY